VADVNELKKVKK